MLSPESKYPPHFTRLWIRKFGPFISWLAKWCQDVTMRQRFHWQPSTLSPMILAGILCLALWGFAVFSARQMTERLIVATADIQVQMAEQVRLIGIILQRSSELERKASKEIQDRNPAKADDQDVSEDPTQYEPSGEDYVPPPTINPVMAEAGPVKTITLEDGTCLECYGDQVRGFEIRHLGRVLPSRFGSLDEADMAVRMFQAHRKNAARNSSADYIEEA
jgi:hypothetical protein